MKTKWYDAGFGLRVLNRISKRVPKWESGVFHRGGIATGTWILGFGLDAKKASEIEAVLALYKTEAEFIAEG